MPCPFFRVLSGFQILSCRCDVIFGPGREKRAGVLYFGLKTQIEQNLFIDSYTFYNITNYRYINCIGDRISVFNSLRGRRHSNWNTVIDSFSSITTL